MKCAKKSAMRQFFKFKGCDATPKIIENEKVYLQGEQTSIIPGETESRKLKFKQINKKWA